MFQWITQGFQALTRWYNSWWEVPTIESDVLHRMYRATAEARASNISIERARYQRHMALSELQALENWNHQHHVLERMPDAQHPAETE